MMQTILLAKHIWICHTWVIMLLLRLCGQLLLLLLLLLALLRIASTVVMRQERSWRSDATKVTFRC